MKIEFGCGETPNYPDYKTCDIRHLPGIDYVCPAYEIDLHIPFNTVTHIFSRHFIEHLTFEQGERWLKACLNILFPDVVTIGKDIIATIDKTDTKAIFIFKTE